MSQPTLLDTDVDDQAEEPSCPLGCRERPRLKGRRGGEELFECPACGLLFAEVTSINGERPAERNSREPLCVPSRRGSRRPGDDRQLSRTTTDAKS
jgi:hypothetical protein